METLIEMVAGLEPRLRQALSSIRVELAPNLTAQVTLSIALHTRAGRDADTVGVDLMTYEAWPRIVRSLSTDTPIVDQFAALEEAATVGRLDIARFQAEGQLRWIAKTHAGSASERRQWLHSL